MSQWNDGQGDPRQHDPTRQFRPDPRAGDPYGQVPPQGPPQQQRGPYGANNPFGTEGNEQFGIGGMVCALLGAILLIVCLTALDWFSTDRHGTLSFGDVGDLLDGRGDATGFASAYFGWFAWVFLLVSVVAAVGSSFPSPALRALRVVGVVAAFAAAGLSFLAIQVTDSRSYVDWLADARVGFYLAVVGFVLIGVGAAIGPRKV
ncbi:hypothetical protein SAMN05443575_3088 [Jatrophihabitans endophyticus]|uniref:Uncharacterized protein n=1 Tax=Jatrophihabitans endophyticus TaxID=1206085 RepID=A0A1M5PHM0_9ACTN|nr:hypothetical protein [Jatrophihabitans endophyticus]SHH01324.1 hypothetical protein SAMN05443575_3088 [Jatrophihabitans endophyticus]